MAVGIQFIYSSLNNGRTLYRAAYRHFEFYFSRVSSHNLNLNLKEYNTDFNSFPHTFFILRFSLHDPDSIALGVVARSPSLTLSQCGQ